MIYLYTEKRDSQDWILKNDLYFNLYTSNLPLTERDKQAIFQIDQAKITENGHIETKYGIGTIRNLPSGCKTYLNIIKNPGKIVSTNECGKNVLTLIFKLDNARIYMSYPERFEIGENVPITFNGKDVVMGKHGYELWWNKEYEMREQHDL